MLGACVEDGDDWGRMAVGLVLAAQGMAEYQDVEKELAAQRARVEVLKDRLWGLRASATKERLDVQGPAGHAVSRLVARLTGSQDRLRKEELEAMHAEMALAVAAEDCDEQAGRIPRLEARLDALRPLRELRNDLLQRKAILLHRAGDERIRQMEAMAGNAARWSRGIRDIRDALELTAACRHGVRVLMQENPRGPGAGKLDAISDGVVGWLGTRRKYSNMDDYNGHALALRDLLRELDASPVVEVPELPEMVPSIDVGEALHNADYWTEVIGPAFLVDLVVLRASRRPMEALRALDAKLSLLQGSLEARSREAQQGLVAWQDEQRRFVAGL